MITMYIFSLTLDILEKDKLASVNEQHIFLLIYVC